MIDRDLRLLRDYAALGVRYLTLTHFKNAEWADASTDTPVHDGLTSFGKDVVREDGSAEEVGAVRPRRFGYGVAGARVSRGLRGLRGFRSFVVRAHAHHLVAASLKFVIDRFD